MVQNDAKIRHFIKTGWTPVKLKFLKSCKRGIKSKIFKNIAKWYKNWTFHKNRLKTTEHQSFGETLEKFIESTILKMAAIWYQNWVFNQNSVKNTKNQGFQKTLKMVWNRTLLKMLQNDTKVTHFTKTLWTTLEREVLKNHKKML